MPSMVAPPQMSTATTTSPETMSRLPLRRSHHATLAPSSGSGRPKLRVAVLGISRYIKPIAMMATAAAIATPIENQCITDLLYRS